MYILDAVHPCFCRLPVDSCTTIASCWSELHACVAIVYTTVRPLQFLSLLPGLSSQTWLQVTSACDKD